MISKNLNICVFPMNIVWHDKAANMSALENAMRMLHPDTDLLLLPETFSTGFPSSLGKEDVRPLAERNTGDTIDFLKRLSRKYDVAIAGSFIADTGGLLGNRAFIIEPSGEECYADKHHLFSMAGEDKIFSRGHSRLSVRYRGWNIAMVVCYDIRFPEWCRNHGTEYDLLVVSANWPTARIDAWNKLLPARAIENLSYVAACNCTGTDPKEISYDGTSHILDFKGNDIAFHHPDAPFIYSSLSLKKLQDFRQKFPAHLDADFTE